ncbi:MAG: carboxypeptidase regulatory-like domain-containing protein [Actinobacteria bacterium]|nr:carboxypeptidase regulatory-like domain-containing protein [Actinomycetota bacterium]
MVTDSKTLRTLLAAALGTVVFLAAAPAHAALKAPTPLEPGSGASVDALPAFSWSAVAGAASYEFQLAADQNFNAPVLGRGEGQFSTRNTRATVKKTVPNGTYWWRVRAATQTGNTSPWSAPRSLRKSWTGAPSSLAPAPGFPFAFPSSPMRVNWSPVPYAASYLFSLASDPALANLVEGAGKPVKTWATNYVPEFNLLPQGTYYWGVTPLDSQGNRGAASTVASFTWSWPSTTSPAVTDLVSADEYFDPQFSWGPVAGATRYEVEVSSSQDFAPGSKVCCAQTTISTSLSPTVVFRDNTYYWRIRALDAVGNSGVWNLGPSFTKTFDKVPPVTAPSIKNLHMRDNQGDPGTDVEPATPGYQTEVPILAWDPVPGASSYFVEVAPYVTGMCTWGISAWRVTTSVPFWTPLGSGWNNVKPYPDPMAVAYDFESLDLSQPYCARVRARGERDSALGEVYGDFTYLDDGTGAAFEFTSYPAGSACTPSCNVGYPGDDDYTLPIRGATTTRTPLFTWRPLAGRASYFVLVAKDPSFSNIVDYGFTQVPAYAPRSRTRATTYADETTLYYWAVLPAASFNGSGAVGNPLAAAASNFQKRSTPSSLMSPPDGALMTEQPVFRWSSVEGARRYRFQVAQEPTFAALLEDVTTASTAYTPFTTHPADTTLYWRVRADDENLIGLTWSSVRQFQRRLPTPVPASDNATSGDFTPTWMWSHVEGASGYTFSMDGPDGTHKEWANLRLRAGAFVYLFGPGIWRWRVRAEFPKATGSVTGPWSSFSSFTRTLSEPANVRTSLSGNHLLLSWGWKLGAKNFRVQISPRQDFTTLIEDVTTDNTSYAPLLLHPTYVNGGSLYWRVAAMDENRNAGEFAPPQKINIAQRLRMAAMGQPRRKKRTLVTVMVSNPVRRPVAAATVRVSGAGIRARSARTNRAGRVTFRLRPTKRGRLSFRATKAGFAAGSLSIRIR